MDSKAVLDYALFQLTPTRTRCDLLVFSGKKSEKLASGLVEPFISHLKYAKDQIPKGGYSITLRPPANGDDASWFTKATFQRFVRFVSTPEILERIVRIEQELLQIESSIQSSEIPNLEETGHPGEGSLFVADGITKKFANSLKSPSEEEDHGTEPRENSRVRLQRLMDTRKALLQKEQAMAYARAVVAGYEMDTIDDLICFADMFGASRLRAACADFKELYNKKHSDDQWIGELAAVQACSVPDLSYMGTSGIMVAGENIHGNGISTTSLMRTGSEPLSDLTATPTNSDGSKENNLPAPEQTPNVQQHVPWMNQIPPYMYNFQGPLQQAPAYQGYPFPGMPPVQPYYQGPVGWSPPGDVIRSKNHQNYRSSSRKEKSLDEKGTDASEEDEQTESGDTDIETDSNGEEEHEKKSSSKGLKNVKKNKKTTSKTVVIRNINYITSQRRNGEEDEISEDSSGETPSLDEASIREGIDNAIASLEKRSHFKGHKSRGKQSSCAQNGLNDNAGVDLRNEIDANITEGRKATNGWDAFQSLLMSHEESASSELPKHPVDSMDEHLVMKNSSCGLSHKTSNALDLESEKSKIQSLTLDDSVLMIQRMGENGGKAHMVDFANGEDTHASMKKIVSEDEKALFSKQFAESRTSALGSLPDFSSELSTIKNLNGEDWFIVNSSGSSGVQEAKQLEFGNDSLLSCERDILQKETAKRTALADDSFIIDSRPTIDENYVSPWRSDIKMDADIDMATHKENGDPTISMSGSVQPDDLCMVLARESQESGASWTPEMDYEVEISFNDTDKSSSTVNTNDHAAEDPLVNGKNASGKKNTAPTAKNLGRDARSRALGDSFAKSKMDSFSKSRKMPSAGRSMVQRSKLEKEEEERKRMEELLLQRQKRIAERTAASGLTPPSSKKLPAGSKSASPRLEKNKPSPAVLGTKRLSQPKLTAKMFA